MYVACRDTRTCVAVGDFGTLLKTTDGGGRWIQRGGCRLQNLTALHFPDPDTGYAVGANGTLCKTVDGGDTWSPRASGTDQELRAVRFSDVSHGMAVGNGGVILSTVDGGDSWAKSESGTYLPLQSVFMTRTSVLIAGSGGIILKSDWAPYTALRPARGSGKGLSDRAGPRPRFSWFDPSRGRWVDVRGRTVRHHHSKW
jgi:hypothetical protein